MVSFHNVFQILKLTIKNVFLLSGGLKKRVCESICFVPNFRRSWIWMTGRHAYVIILQLQICQCDSGCYKPIMFQVQGLEPYRNWPVLDRNLLKILGTKPDRNPFLHFFRNRNLYFDLYIFTVFSVPKSSRYFIYGVNR